MQVAREPGRRVGIQILKKAGDLGRPHGVVLAATMNDLKGTH
jgi:hypothetical protein